MITHNARTKYGALAEVARAAERRKFVKTQREEEQRKSKERSKKFPLAKVWSKAEEGFAASLRIQKDAFKGSLPYDDVEATTKRLLRKRNKRDGALNRDLEVSYATAIEAPGPKSRRNLVESCCEVLGITEYKSSTLFSLLLQASGFEASMASKRAAICRYALAMQTLPSKLMSFIAEQGGVERCATAARQFEEMLEGELQVAVVTKVGGKRHTLFSYSDAEYVSAAWEKFRKLPDAVREVGYFADKNVVEKLMRRHR